MTVEAVQSVSEAKLYSPTQVALSAFCGGPFAAVFVLKKNFDVLGGGSNSKKTIIWGAIFIVVLLLMLPFLPEGTPNVALPVAYAFAARSIAEKYQMSKKAILDSQQFSFQSNWNVFGISVGFAILFMLIFIGWIFTLQALGLVKI